MLTTTISAPLLKPAPQSDSVTLVALEGTFATRQTRYTKKVVFRMYCTTSLFLYDKYTQYKNTQCVLHYNKTILVYCVLYVK